MEDQGISLPFSSLIEVLRRRLRESAGAPAYTFLLDGEEAEERCTYAELDARARALGATLQAMGLQGERALLLYPPGLDFVTAFWGCLYAGTVAVPAYPPRTSHPDLRIAAIARDARPRIALTNQASLEKTRRWSEQVPDLAGLSWLASDRVPLEEAEGWRDPGARPETLAFLQYTSGSTSLPKGVMVSHGNLLHNEEMIRRAFGQSSESVIVGWLPLYHDMGLIGNVLQPLYVGARCILMSPLAFLQKPLRWLQAISRYRATTSGGPNFAYELCATKIGTEQREGLDLSSWTVAFSGAEPVREETLDRFAAAFASCGFHREAFYPCYGLAEGTLFATGGLAGAAPVAVPFQRAALERRAVEPAAAGGEGVRSLVGCGHAWMGQEVAIVDPETGAECPPDRVGEIWVSGPSVAQGYWGRPEDSDRLFRARPAGRLTGAFLRTGDLGFVRDGHLFIAGRLKDLIILRGRNHYPEDVERTVEASHPEVRPGSCAVFSVEVQGEEGIVAVLELERRSRADAGAVLAAVRSAVAEAHEAQLHEVVLVRQGNVPKTSSGKVQRHACRNAWLAGDLEVIARSGASPDGGAAGGTGLTREDLLAAEPAERLPILLAYLRERAARAARMAPETLEEDRPLAGLDSLAALELKNAVEGDLGVSLSVASLLAGASLRRLAGEVLEGLTGGTAGEPLTAAAEPPAELPLSHGQRALWFLDRLAPGEAAYVIAGAARVSGEIDPEALRRALRRLADLHPALRTTFAAPGGEPVQRVHAELPPEVRIVDALGWTEGEIAARAREEAFRPFDLEAGPLLRAVVFSRPGEPVLLLAVHHLVADFASLALLLRQLAELLREPEKPLAAPAVRYSDFVDWQRRRLAGKEGERLWGYWRERLSGPLPDLTLPTDRPRPPVQTWAGDTAWSTLDGDLTRRLRELARGEGATLQALLLAAFHALLQRYSGQDDLLVGCPVSGRTGPKLADLVGYLVNVVVARGDLSGDPAFREHLARVRRSMLDALEHQDYPFPLLAERLQPARDPSRSPLFQVMLSFQKAAGPGDLAALAVEDPETGVGLGALRLKPLRLARRPAQLDLTLEIAEAGDRLSLALRFNADLFDAATAERALGHFAVLLAGAAERPESALSALPLLTAAESRQLLDAWNDTAAPPVWEEGCVHRLFEAQADRAPEAVAVEDEAGSVTYAGLERRANQLAHYLRRLGVGPEVRVGLAVDRSREMMVGLLGTLKAGGAYLPLDPSYPPERLAFMLEDSGVRIVLTQERLAASLPAGSGEVLLRLDSDWEGTAGLEAASRPAPWAGPKNLAYTIYTSGSTGRPKGVLLEHAAVVNFLSAMSVRPGLGAEDVLLSVTTLSFDIAVLELFLPLAVGGRVAIASRETAGDGARLVAALARTGATAMQATPATWRLLLESGWEGQAGLKILCGGEALPRPLADALLARGREVWNVYGPTETTIWSAAGRVEAGSAPVDLGAPIDNTTLYVVDRRLQPVPVLVPGELLIGGDGVARGYHGRPDLTADRFVPDPFGLPGARLYRTGDLVRRLADGTVQFLGRVDHQVKVRGHRIELGEIEARLAAHPAVREAVVLAREDRPGDQRLVAYAIARGELPAAAELKGWLRERLPEPMVPGIFVFLDAWPLTPNGKVDRRALPAPRRAASPEAAAPLPAGGLEAAIAEVWREVLGVETVGLKDNFFDLGGHSLLLARVHARLQEALGVSLTMVDLLRHPTVGALAAFLRDERGVRPRRRAQAAGRGDIAIVAMTGRFPGAADVERFWSNLREGVESITFFSEGELEGAGVPADLLRDPAYVRAGAVLEDVELFDADFFGLTPREAAVLDPQHRLFLECAWEALELAGYDPERYAGAVGVYAGVGINTYLLNNLRANREVLEAVGSYQAFIGNDKDFVPTRVSYKLNLRGPSLNVQTACSSSLVAVHLARQALLLGECDMALAGGVSLAVPHRVGYLYQEGGIPSPDGHCRAFDARSRGTVRGNGVGLVVLKRLEDALADGDRIRAVIKGSALNNDGSGKVGYTAPSVDGQAEVIAAALEAAGVEPESVGYVEAHGTGTELGDPIEVAALTQAWRAVGASRQGFCALGSVKTNIGHLDTAAGAAGLIKASLALERGEIPPSLHFEQPNPKIDFAASPFYVNTGLRPWTREGEAPRRAAVSSFGIGGTNAHVILEEAPALAPSGPSRPAQLLVLSARTDTALDAATVNLAAHLRANPDLPLADVAWTLEVGRKVFSHRRFAVASSLDEAARVLETLDPERVVTGFAEGGARPVAFLFPGQGSQHFEMGLGLYRDEPLFREVVDTCAGRLRPLLGRDLREILFAAPGGDLERTEIAQPALFTIEIALARLWMSWGVRPDALLGHSVGELAAACLAGVFSLEDALALVAERGRLMGAQPEGAMLAVPLPEDKALALTCGNISLAAVNGPAACTLAGTVEAIDALERRLAELGLETRRLHVSHAFHTWMMEPAAAAFAERVAAVRREPPRLPILSNVTGTWLTAEEAQDPAYWAGHLLRPVRFAAGVAELVHDPRRILLEVGPGAALSTLVRQHPAKPVAVASLRHPRDPRPDLEVLLHAAGRLWMEGVGVDWEGFHAGERRQRATLPTYPFDRRRHWVDPVRTEETAVAARPAAAAGLRFYAPLWKESLPPSPAAPIDAAASWVVFVDGAGVGERLADRLEGRGARVARVRAGESFDALLAGLGEGPAHLVYCWTAEPLPAESVREIAFHNLVRIAQALGRRGAAGPVRLTVVSTGMHRLGGERGASPEKALALGPCRVIPQEYPDLRCQSVDFADGEDPEEIADLTFLELAAEPADPAVAWRGGSRWVRAFEPAPLAAPEGPGPRLREQGVYLVTGGLGGIGLTLADLLARRVRARLALAGRRPPTGRTLEHLRELEALGAEVLVLQADVTDRESMAAALAAVRERFGALHGVIHAAGLPGGGVIQLKTAEAAERVFAPKVQGTRVLAGLLDGEPLDFVLLCSSVTAFAGGFGQVDYCAANAFLDAFARARASRRGPFWTAVAWDRWQEVGMAVAAGATADGGAPVHPLLDRCLLATPEKVVYSTELSVERHWVLSEHRILGRATVPGTTYLEMVLAAFQQATSSPEVEIRETAFLTPLVVDDGHRAEALTILQKEKDAEFYTFRVVSRPAGSAGAWREHARGKVGRPEPAEPRSLDLAALRARCTEDLARAGEDHARGLEGFLATGPRWRSLRSLHASGPESLAALELDPAFADEVRELGLYPPLLDVAAGSVQLRAEGSFLPLAYERLVVRAPLPPAFFSLARLRDGGESGSDTLTCDLTLLDGEGRELVEISGFSMRRIGEEALRQLRGLEGSGDAASQREGEAALAGGLSPLEGADAFLRVLAGPLHHVVAAGRDLPAILGEANEQSAESLLERLGRLDLPAEVHARPQVRSRFTAPGSELEATIAEVWQKVLGIDQIGIHDNFFELGGSSLSGVQLTSELKKALGVEIPTVSIFEAPTISALARRLDPKKAEATYEHSRDRARKKLEVLERQREQMRARRRGN